MIIGVLYVLLSGLLLAITEAGASAATHPDRSRMIIDENFLGREGSETVQRFRVYGGQWLAADGVLHAPAGPGPKLVAETPPVTAGQVGVEVLFPAAADGNAGLLVKVSDPGVGADRFNGYEIALDTSGQLRLGRHRQNFEPIRDVPCPVPVNRWIALAVRMRETTLEVTVDGKMILSYEDREHPLHSGHVALRTWQREARFRNLWIATEGEKQTIPFRPADAEAGLSSGWFPVRSGSVQGDFAVTDVSHSPQQAQQISHLGGNGKLGIAYAGDDGQGMDWRVGRPYQGWLWAQAEDPAELLLAAETATQQPVATARLPVAAGDWQMVPFCFSPERNAEGGRLAITLTAPGVVRLGRVFLEPGDWAWPKPLRTADLPPIAVVMRHPLTAPPAVGQDLAAAQPQRGGCSIRILTPSRPEELQTVFDDPTGCIYDMNVSYDAETLYFSYRGEEESHWHIWRIGTDGNGPRQLTEGPYQDVSPCPLPDGDLVFVSTRRFGHTVCQPGPASNLYRMAADGSDLRCVSMNTLSDMSPQMLPDGRVLFTRWEYIDRDLTYRQSLWTQYPDGTHYALYFGNTVRDVGTFWQARPLPGRNDRVVATFAPHHGFPHGAIGLIDRGHGVEGPRGRSFRYITKEFPVIGDRSHEWSYRDPFPLGDDRFLCSFGGGGVERYRIYLLDAEGNRRLVYEDPRLSCYFPLPMRPVPAPPLLSSQEEQPGHLPEAAANDPMGVVFLADIYEGLEPAIRRGQVKELRVLEQVRKTEDLAARAYDQSPVMSYGTYYAKRNWGTVPVEEDGSACFRVPALREVYFQALDDQGRELQRMTSALQVMPGEQVSCIGCHESRQTAPPASAGLPLASRRPPRRLERPDWGHDGLIDFPGLVQPVLDEHCVECHHGADPEGGYDLSGDKTRLFSMAYDNLLGRSRAYRQHDLATGAMLPEEQARGKPLVHFYWLLRTPTAVNQPLWTGSHASRLPEYIEGDHGNGPLPLEDRRRIYLWIDANVPYYGTYANSRPHSPGKRDLATDPLTGQPALWFTDGFLRIYNRRCADCHGTYPHPNDHSAIWDGRLAWINFTHPAWSPALTAHLPKDAGGRGIEATTNHGQPAGFTATNDPDYQTMLRAIQQGKRLAEETPRADMPGFTGARPEP